MGNLYIESRLQAIKEIASSSCVDSKGISNIIDFCNEIQSAISNVNEIVKELRENSYVEAVDDSDPFGDIPNKVISLKKAIEIVTGRSFVSNSEYEYVEAQKFLESLDWGDIPNSEKPLTTICEALQEIQKYKSMEKQKVLMQFPVPIGTTVYKIEFGTKRWVKTTVTRYDVYSDSVWFCFSNGLGRNIVDFGEFVFLTQEEAEKKLKEIESD